MEVEEDGAQFLAGVGGGSLGGRWLTLAAVLGLINPTQVVNVWEELLVLFTSWMKQIRQGTNQKEGSRERMGAFVSF